MPKSWPTGLRALGVVFVGWVLAIWIDPYVGLHSSAAVMLVDAVVPLGILLLVWGLTGRAWCAWLIEAAVMAALCTANRIKAANLQTDLVYADFRVIGSLLHDPKLYWVSYTRGPCGGCGLHSASRPSCSPRG